MYEISEKYQDIAGKWRVRVAIGSIETIFIKFQKEPTKTEVTDAAIAYLANREAERVRRAAEEAQRTLDAEKLALVKDIAIADLRTKLESKPVAGVAEKEIV